MNKRILAGDVGGTKTLLCLYQVDADGLRELRKTTYPSGQQTRFNDLLEVFLGADKDLTAACFGIAGPVMDDRCDTTNLPWLIDAREIERTFNIPKVTLLNDLEAAAYGMLHLGADDFIELNPHAEEQLGHKAILAAGTGLGEAILHFNGTNYQAMPTEGGHSDFAPQNNREDALLVSLRKRFGGHVSYERILAGDGFGTLYDFLMGDNRNQTLAAEMRLDDRNAVISRHGVAGDDPVCVEALSMFCRIYGAEAGNLALKSLPVGGLYIGGGIGPKILPVLRNGAFLEGFLDKGRMRRAIEHIPLRLALNPEAPLLGAAHHAASI